MDTPIIAPVEAVDWIYLASASPRRRELLTQIGVSRRLLAVEVDESPLAGESPIELVRRLAIAKARAGSAWLGGGGHPPVLAADDPFAAARVARYQRRPAEELYDLDADPAELNDLASDPGSADVLARLRGTVDAWMAEQGDRGLPEETAP